MAINLQVTMNEKGRCFVTGHPCMHATEPGGWWQMLWNGSDAAEVCKTLYTVDLC